MLTFAIAAGVTAGLGFLVKQIPAIAFGLEGFARWAGLFMQIAGVLEALRRIVNTDNPFNLTPAAPVVTFAGGPSVPAAGASRPTQGSHMRPSAPTSRHVQVVSEEPQRSSDEAEIARLQRMVKPMTVEWVRDNQPRAIEIMRDIEVTFDLTGHVNPETGDIDILEFIDDKVGQIAWGMRNKVRALLQEIQNE